MFPLQSPLLRFGQTLLTLAARPLRFPHARRPAATAQDMNIVQDEMDKEIAEFKFQFSKPSEYDDAEPADGAEAPAE
jgi:hypothetical protein